MSRHDIRMKIVRKSAKEKIKKMGTKKSREQMKTLMQFTRFLFELWWSETISSELVSHDFVSSSLIHFEIVNNWVHRISKTEEDSFWFIYFLRLSVADKWKSKQIFRFCLCFIFVCDWIAVLLSFIDRLISLF